jgi:hypothetical protein
MFEQSVGLYNGANMSLLRTVLEVNLQLFQSNRYFILQFTHTTSSSKTCLLFVLRDSTGQTPLEALAKTLTEDLERIWLSLNKPKGKENAQLSDYFDLSFASAAHKIFLPEKFQSDLSSLRSRFHDNSSSEYVLKPKYHKGIPADGFSLYAKSIWDKILHNRDLDLPTQQQLLAQFRCDEIASLVFAKFAEATLPFKKELDKGQVCQNFGQELLTIRKEAIGILYQEI